MTTAGPGSSIAAPPPPPRGRGGSAPDGLPFADLRPVFLPGRRFPTDPVDPYAARLIDEPTARRNGLIPFSVTDDRFHVAITADVPSGVLRALDPSGRKVELWRAAPLEVASAQDRVWDPGAQGPRKIGQLLVEDGSATGSTVEAALAQQQVSGGRVGDILVGSHSLSPYRIARAVARQSRLPLIDLVNAQGGRQGLTSLDPALFHAVPESFWRDRMMVPFEVHGDEVFVAMADPEDLGAIAELEDMTGWKIRRAVTARRDVSAALRWIYEGQFTYEAHSGLRTERPQDSAARVLSLPQRVWMICLALLLVLCASLWPLATFLVVNAIGQLYYLGLATFKLMIHMNAGGQERSRRVDVVELELREVDRHQLPIYTILIPVFREAGVLPVLARALGELDYPHDRLDVKLLIEAVDTETMEAALSLDLPNFIEIVVVPASEPQTKPKACNYGLQFARGEFTVIFDAEDIPEPDQLLKAVLAFQKSPPEVACIQAKLAYFNRGQNLLTKWFTAEYLMWFDHVLPALHAFKLPIPLGGTSNHFRTSVLRELIAWDPFNVAEDADLGIRLDKAGYQTAVVDAITFEEANSRLGSWVRQRSRWVKGYMQTWLVHMRHPIELWRGLGPRGFLGFHLIVGGTPATFLLTPFYMLLTTLWFATRWPSLQSLFPSWIYWLAAFNLLVGTFAFSYAHLIAVARRNVWDLAPWVAMSPVYWMLMSIASYRALWQLFTRPSFWEKTEHGFTDVHQPPIYADVESS